MISVLKTEYNVSALYLIPPLDFPLYKNNWFDFNGKTGFPVYVGDPSFGALICFQAFSDFKAQRIRMFIDGYFQKMCLKIAFMSNDNSFMDLCSLSSSFFYAEDELAFLSLFLIKQKNREDVLKAAQEIYLKSSCFAFLNAEDLEWREGLFQDMSGVFVCVPSVRCLSAFQTKILFQDLFEKALPCRLALGI